MTTRAATYRRVSTYNQVGGTSPQTQLARAEALIARERWEHVGDFYDPAVSGAKDSRPGLDRLFELCRAGGVDVVIVGDLFRLSRDMRNSLNFEYELDRLGVQVIDLENPNADEVARMFSYMQGHWMRREIRKNTQRGIRATAEAGYWVASPPPFGWRIAQAPDHAKHKVLELDEDEAETVRLAVALVVDEGLSCWEAAKRLDALRRASRTGTRWTNTNLKWMLQRDCLSGTWVFARRGANPTPISIPPILARERHDQLRRTLSAQSTGARPSSRAYALTGLVFGLCGEPYNGSHQNGRNRQYECRTNNSKYDGTGRRCHDKRINADWLEQTVWAEVMKVLSDPEQLFRMARQYQAKARKTRSAPGDLSLRIEAAKRKRTNLMLAAAGLDAGAIKDAFAEVQRQIDELERMHEKAEAWAQLNADRASTIENLGRMVNEAQARLADPTPERMRAVLVALQVRVTIVKEMPGGTPYIHIASVGSGESAEGNRGTTQPRRRGKDG